MFLVTLAISLLERVVAYVSESASTQSYLCSFRSIDVRRAFWELTAPRLDDDIRGHDFRTASL